MFSSLPKTNFNSLVTFILSANAFNWDQHIILFCRELSIKRSIQYDYFCYLLPQLLQSTIESLLPKDEEDEDGYELSSVLNKTIGPLNCLVVEKGQNWAYFLKEIELLS